jgi:hypothetical protein
MLLLVSCPALLAGCDMVTGIAESEAHGAPIAAEIEREVGKRPTVISSTTGSILFVTVQFSEVPSADVPTLEAVTREAIVREFKKEPTTLTSSFVYNSWDKQP